MLQHCQLQTLHSALLGNLPAEHAGSTMQQALLCHFCPGRLLVQVLQHQMWPGWTLTWAPAKPGSHVTRFLCTLATMSASSIAMSALEW